MASFAPARRGAESARRAGARLAQWAERAIQRQANQDRHDRGCRDARPSFPAAVPTPGGHHGLPNIAQIKGLVGFHVFYMLPSPLASKFRASLLSRKFPVFFFFKYELTAFVQLFPSSQGLADPPLRHAPFPAYFPIHPSVCLTDDGSLRKGGPNFVAAGADGRTDPLPFISPACPTRLRLIFLVFPPSCLATCPTDLVMTIVPIPCFQCRY